MTSLRINPLDIPEIRSMVGQYLRRSDLARCLRVCKSWHASFVSLVWSTTTVVQEIYSRGRNPPLEAFIRYSHYLKDLFLNIDAPKDYRVAPCPNLLNLKVHIMRVYLKKKPIDIVPVVIAQYQQLRRLSIQASPMISQRVIWKPVHYHNLSELDLDLLEIEPAGTVAFWELCTQLVSLKFEKVTVAEMPARSITFDRLQRLRLELKSRNSLEHQLEWITQCPNLTSLHWCYSDNPSSGVMRRFVPGTWLHLSELSLSRIEFTDAQMARVIGAMQDLKSLSVQTCEVGSRFLEALHHHSQTLTLLATISCGVLTPSFVPEILASFPHLENLYVQRVKSKDIIDSPPWVCERSLKVLRIGISFSLNQGAEYQRQVLQRISRLTNLNKLIVDRGRQIEYSLDLRLENGLDQLATLKQLEKLELLFYMEHISVRDVEWMINNWKSLKVVDGYFRLPKQEELLSMFTAAGIKC
ncbi:MAG: hypothetical protein J3Q66DRAFT_65056 [Benniella sp.]|nr:MAG: hypothetical protein J3Q66DRAFT_65056 [Benniella sp.]